VANLPCCKVRWAPTAEEDVSEPGGGQRLVTTRDHM
jgi:hypothetical protein